MMKLYTEYEDLLVWELYDEIVLLLEDMRRIMFLKGLEDLNERSILYFENVRHMFYDENKKLDTEMILTSTARWLAMVHKYVPHYLTTAEEFVISKIKDDSILSNTENLSYYQLLLFIVLGNEEFEIDISLGKENKVSNISDAIDDLFGAIDKKDFTFNRPPKTGKVLTSYKWSGRSGDLLELHSALRNYIKPCEFERFAYIFSDNYLMALSQSSGLVMLMSYYILLLK